MSSGYEVCQALMGAIEEEVLALKALQRRRQSGEDFTGKVRMLADGLAKLQGELRKTSVGADKAVTNLSPEKQLDLILKIIDAMPPDHRRAVQLFIEEKGGKLL